MIDSVDAKNDGGNYVTVGEAARFLGVGRKVVYQLIEFKRIRAGRRRQVILVEKSSLEEFRSSGGLA